jgi:hypothetical protein
VSATPGPRHPDTTCPELALILDIPLPYVYGVLMAYGIEPHPRPADPKKPRVGNPAKVITWAERQEVLRRWRAAGHKAAA